MIRRQNFFGILLSAVNFGNKIKYKFNGEGNKFITLQTLEFQTFIAIIYFDCIWT